MVTVRGRDDGSLRITHNPVGRFPLAGLLFELLGYQIRLLFALHELPGPFSMTIKIAKLEMRNCVPSCP